MIVSEAGATYGCGLDFRFLALPHPSVLTVFVVDRITLTRGSESIPQLGMTTANNPWVVVQGGIRASNCGNLTARDGTPSHVGCLAQVIAHEFGHQVFQDHFANSDPYHAPPSACTSSSTHLMCRFTSSLQPTLPRADLQAAYGSTRFTSVNGTL